MANAALQSSSSSITKPTIAAIRMAVGMQLVIVRVTIAAVGVGTTATVVGRLGKVGL